MKNRYLVFFKGLFIVFGILLSTKACKHASEMESGAQAARNYNGNGFGITKATYRCYGALSDASCMVEYRDSVFCGYGKGKTWISADPGNFLNAGISDSIMMSNGTSECGQCLEISGIGGTIQVMVTDKGHSAGGGVVAPDTVDLDNSAYQRISGESLDHLAQQAGKYVMSVRNTSQSLGYKHPVSVKKVPCHNVFSPSERKMMYVPLDVSPGTTDFNIRRGKSAVAKVEMSFDQGVSWHTLEYAWGATFRLRSGYSTGFSANRHVKVKITWKDQSVFSDQFYYTGQANTDMMGTQSW